MFLFPFLEEETEVRKGTENRAHMSWLQPWAVMASVNRGLNVPLGSGQRLALSRNGEDPDDAREAGLSLLCWAPGLTSKNHSRMPVECRTWGEVYGRHGERKPDFIYMEPIREGQAGHNYA